MTEYRFVIDGTPTEGEYLDLANLAEAWFDRDGETLNTQVCKALLDLKWAVVEAVKDHALFEAS